MLGVTAELWGSFLFNFFFILQTEQLPEEEAKGLKKNHKAAETLTIILTALFFSYLPVTVLFGSATFSDDLVEPHMLYILSTCSYTFAYFCSLLNPLIYCWRLEKLRGALFDILHTAFMAGTRQLGCGIANAAK